MAKALDKPLISAPKGAFVVALVEPWWSLGGALVEPWGGLGVALGWLCTPESMPSIWLCGGLVVALRWLCTLESPRSLCRVYA